eukprot:8810682-Pyramimonas_sp.AAC.1
MAQRCMPHGSQEAPKRAHERPKRAPRGTRRGTQEAPERPQRAQDDLQDGPDSPSWLKMSPKDAQTGPKTAPRRS